MKTIYRYNTESEVKYFSTAKKAFDYAKDRHSIHRHFAVFKRWIDHIGYYQIDNNEDMLPENWNQIQKIDLI